MYYLLCFQITRNETKPGNLTELVSRVLEVVGLVSAEDQRPSLTFNLTWLQDGVWAQMAERIGALFDQPLQR